MAGTTANYDLPYPTGGDSFCDGWDYLERLAKATALVLDDFDFDEARLELVPFVRVSSSVPYTPDSVGVAIGYLSFDTVDVDTAGIADPGVDPRRLLVPADGIWSDGTYAKFLSTGAAGSILTVQMNDSVSFYSQRDGGAGTEGQLQASGMLGGTGIADTAVYSFLTSASAQPSVTTSRMWMFWMSDAP